MGERCRLPRRSDPRWRQRADGLFQWTIEFCGRKAPGLGEAECPLAGDLQRVWAPGRRVLCAVDGPYLCLRPVVEQPNIKKIQLQHVIHRKVVVLHLPCHCVAEALDADQHARVLIREGGHQQEHMCQRLFAVDLPYVVEHGGEGKLDIRDGWLGLVRVRMRPIRAPCAELRQLQGRLPAKHLEISLLLPTVAERVQQQPVVATVRIRPPTHSGDRVLTNELASLVDVDATLRPGHRIEEVVEKKERYVERTGN
mmetsp:Transcript_67172/g.194230  ORF Transcript_67172/g.194230 Transcript_67172/m.194230 type:complete len:254 (-) Transcript_67172:378-1139(-)